MTCPICDEEIDVEHCERQDGMRFCSDFCVEVWLELKDNGVDPEAIA